MRRIGKGIKYVLFHTEEPVQNIIGKKVKSSFAGFIMTAMISRDSFGVNLGRYIVTNGTMRRSHSAASGGDVLFPKYLENSCFSGSNPHRTTLGVTVMATFLMKTRKTLPLIEDRGQSDSVNKLTRTRFHRCRMHRPRRAARIAALARS